jgi:exonuclease SbcC
MSHGPLRTLTITDFRGIRDSANPIALDAPVVLIHGTNGAGKSTVMAALELALTGATSGIEQRHHEHLVHRGRPRATVELVASKRTVEASIDRARIDTDPLLDLADRRVFAERCYLEQRTLGRLIEVYEASKEGFDSRLTAFVKDLLGLDELDALIEGLKPVMDKRNVKSLVPAYRDLERERDHAQGRILDGKAALTAAIERVRLARSELAEQFAELGSPSSTPEDPENARGWIASETSSARRALAALREQRLELAALARRATDLDQGATAAEIAELEEAAGVAVRNAEQWRSTHGAALDTLLDGLRVALPALPDAIGSADPAAVRAAAVEQVVGALERVARTLELDAGARAKYATLETARETAQLRLASIDEQLTTSEHATAAEELGRALSALVPHIHSEDCPVCGRDYSEISHEPLTAHLASRIASFSTEAERLRELAKARLEALSDLRDLERQLAEAGAGTLAPETQRDTQALDTRLRDARKRLSDLADRVDAGGELMRAATERERELAVTRGRDHASSELRAELAQHVSALDEKPPDTATSLAEAIAGLAGARGWEDRDPGAPRASPRGGISRGRALRE